MPYLVPRTFIHLYLSSLLPILSFSPHSNLPSLLSLLSTLYPFFTSAFIIYSHLLSFLHKPFLSPPHHLHLLALSYLTFLLPFPHLRSFPCEFYLLYIIFISLHSPSSLSYYSFLIFAASLATFISFKIHHLHLSLYLFTFPCLRLSSHLLLDTKEENVTHTKKARTQVILAYDNTKRPRRETQR